MHKTFAYRFLLDSRLRLDVRVWVSIDGSWALQGCIVQEYGKGDLFWVKSEGLF